MILKLAKIGQIPQSLAMVRLLFLLASMFLLVTSATGQTSNTVQFNLGTGLPSNHVYSTIQDRNGYLWIATDNGVLRYNGYTFRKFGVSDGLPSNDMWKLYEDKKGRIWTLTNSYKQGYIQNDRFHAIALPDQLSLVGPKDITEVGDAVLFYYWQNNRPWLAIFSDHFTSYIDHKELRNRWDILNFGFNGPRVWGIGYGSHIKQYSPFNSSTSPIKNCFIPQGLNVYTIAANTYIPYGSFMYTYINKTSQITAFDITKCTFSTLTLDGEYIYIMCPLKNALLCITDKSVYQINGTELKKIRSTAEVVNDQVTWQHVDRGANIWLSTLNSGLIMQSRSFNWQDHLQSSNILENCVYKGTLNDNTYWWNENTGHLLVMKGNRLQKKLHFPGTGNMQSFSHLKGKILLSFVTGIYILENDKLSPLFSPPRTTVLVNNDMFDSAVSVVIRDKEITKYTGRGSSLHALNDSTVLLSTQAGMLKLSQQHDSVFADYLMRKKLDGFVRLPRSGRFLFFDKRTVILYSGGSTLRTFHADDIKHLGTSKLLRLLADSLHGTAIKDITNLITTRNSKLFLVMTEGPRTYTTYDANELQKIGIDQVLTILADSTGNIFVQDVDKLIVYNTVTNRLRRYRFNYPLQNANIHLYKNMLVVSGLHGVSLYDVGINGAIRLRQTLENFKGKDLNTLKASVVDPTGRILLLTDKGYYSVRLDSVVNRTQVFPDPFLFVLREPIAKKVTNNDTIVLSESLSKLSFDAINFHGAGSLVFKYKLPGRDWQQSNSGEILLEDLRPDQYYPIRIYVQDNLWSSRHLTLYAFRTPYWYQTSAWRSAFAILGLLFFLGSLYLVFAITKRRVAAVNERKRLQTELELRAIHSQINPHFIFNTLSTALYFMKKEQTKEAYEHVDKFSKLLRAYLRSSRERWTTLAEDIAILDQYIQLQRTRLQNRLQYTIKVDEKLKPDQVMIPSLLLQPLVENAIHHGLFNKSGDGWLNISFRQDLNSSLICTIEDNGIGRARAKELKARQIDTHRSYGTELTSDLIQIFKKFEQLDITVQYIDKPRPETGTIVIITFKKTKKVYE